MNPPTNPAPTTDPTTDPTPTPVPQPPAPPDQPRFTQADLDRAISDRLARERKSAEEKSAKERQAAEQEKLKAQAEWEELAKQHEQTVRDLSPQLETAQTRYTVLAERLNKQIDAGIKDWPAEARRMVPAGDDVAARLDAYENMRGLLEKGSLAPRQPGNAANPRPTSGPDAGKKTEEMLRSTGRYQAI